jgi:hypothetical protein
MAVRLAADAEQQRRAERDAALPDRIVKRRSAASSMASST